MRVSAELMDAQVKTDMRSEFDNVLWNKLEEFQLDRPQSGLTFTERLARENGWTLRFARRVAMEYKRFLYLAMKCQHVVCPSDAVDQVWHMHLTYTRSYWEELCTKVLKRPLHHGPTQGGSHEHEKYFRLYEKTLDSYSAHFGEAAPNDIWPAATQRFGSDLNFVRVNSHANFIIPKPSWNQAAVGTASVATAGAVLSFPIAQLVANPLNWNGTQFLILFVGLLFSGAVASLIFRYVFTATDSQTAEPNAPQIGPLEAAWLEGGNQRALSCALIDLAQSDAIKVEGSALHVGPNGYAAQPEHRLSKLMLQSVVDAPNGSNWRRVSRDANSALVQMKQKLEDVGFIHGSSTRMLVSGVTVMLLAPIIVLGAAKLYVGVSRGKPVGFLVIGEIVAILCLFALVKTAPLVTSAGKRYLQSMRSRLAAQNAGENEQVEQSNSQSPFGNDMLLWSTALLGTTVLMDTPFSPFHSFFQQHAGASGASTGGCSAGCGGDSGCGGGGGCGGGCGGCGGD
ncbi:MAG: TIGR04222 domain-containing membrane protein [Planctomycetales bacterium]|nr:TIGR04222 domain-containing membrane protein [Planctomycetales bacterium]